MMNRRTALSVAMVIGSLGLGLLAGNLRATPGTATRPSFMYVGTLTGVPDGTQSFTFNFDKGGFHCGPIVVSTDVAAGRFAASIPVTSCGVDYFDGGNVSLTVDVAGVHAVQLVAPVPYAKYADRAGRTDYAQAAGTASIASSAITASSAIIASTAYHAYNADNAAYATSANLASGLMLNGADYSERNVVCIAPSADANFGSYFAADAHCKSACGSGAHVCSAQELLRRAATTAPSSVAPSGSMLRYATGTTGTITSGVTRTLDDCAAFTTNDDSHASHVWVDGKPSSVSCATLAPYACCQ